ncbi:MAG: glycosyl hydrolase family 28-related protein [bacterium]
MDIRFPKEAKQIVDVTKPPYNCDPTGKEDCTAALVQALDDIIELDREGFRETQDRYAKYPFELEGTPESNKVFGAIYPLSPPPARILYFPKGVYLVSDTIRYTFRDLQNPIGKELDRMIHFRGESEAESVIKLKDHCEGFEAGAERPVVDFMGGISTNTAMHNFFENLTIDVGAGNPGAVGMVYFSNNSGAIRHVTLRSSDPDGLGQAGFLVRNRNTSCTLVQHLTVEGFDVGVQILHDRLNVVMEHVTVRNQRRFGVHIDRQNVSLRGVRSENGVPALKITGRASVVAFLDSDLKGGKKGEPAIDLRDGYLFARNIDTEGYCCALRQQGSTEIPQARINEFVAGDKIVLFAEENRNSLNLSVEETPEIAWENDHSMWACVNDFGAAGDGVHDDTEAIRKAIASGKPVVWFQPGRYLVSDTIDLPASLKRLNFMHGEIATERQFRRCMGAGVFRVNADAEDPLIIEDLFAMEELRGGVYFIDHACTRTLVLSDLSTVMCSQYKNTVEGGKVFFENVYSMNQFRQQDSPFVIKGNRAWGRQMNPERSDPEIVNDGGDLWLLGFKTEWATTSFLTKNGGRTEVLGGTINQCIGPKSPSTIINQDSDVCVVTGTTDWRPIDARSHTMIEEKRGDITRKLAWAEFPIREGQLIAIPLYVGRASGKKDK